MTYYIPDATDGTPRTDVIVRLPDWAWIPCDPENTDYQAYLAWVAEGNTPLPWPPVS